MPSLEAPTWNMRFQRSCTTARRRFFFLHGADLATTGAHFRFIPMLTVIIPDSDT